MRKAQKKTHRDQMMRCPYCGAAVFLRPASTVHPGDRSGKKVYVCSRYPVCDAYVGADSLSGRPLGTPADSDLRDLRIRAHQSFDKIWQEGIMTKNEAYRWLADSLGLKMSDAHIGRCREYQCRELIRLSDEVCSNFRLVQGGGERV